VRPLAASCRRRPLSRTADIAEHSADPAICFARHVIVMSSNTQKVSARMASAARVNAKEIRYSADKKN
jgi:hypothetical protein